MGHSNYSENKARTASLNYDEVMMMLKIKFCVLDKDEILTGFELGGIEIKSDQCKYTLDNPKKYFMVFLTVRDLSDAIYSFYNSKEKSKEIICADSSFYFRIIRNRNKTVAFYVEDTHMGDFTMPYILNKVFIACKYFYKEYGNKLQCGNPVKNDLEDSIKCLEELIIKISCFED